MKDPQFQASWNGHSFIGPEAKMIPYYFPYRLHAYLHCFFPGYFFKTQIFSRCLDHTCQIGARSKGLWYLTPITVRKIETHDREVSRTAMKGRTVTSVKNCKSQDPERALISIQWLGRHLISHGQALHYLSTYPVQVCLSYCPRCWRESHE